MKILTDCPDALNRWLPSVRPMRAADLPAGERDAWRALSSQEWLFTSSLPGPGSTAVVIDRAPRSQFVALLDVLKQGIELPQGLAAVALEGQGFKGQRERSWSAVRGNLHLCVYYRLGANASRLGTGLTVLPAVAATAAMRRVTGERVQPGIKWVNDILVDGRKIAGVLTTTQASGSTIEQVVFGIGINVAVTPAVSSTPFVPGAGCLGLGLAWHQVLGPLLEEIDHACRTLLAAGPIPLIDRYRAESLVLNRRVRVWPEGTPDPAGTPPRTEGVVTSIDDDLALHLAGIAEPIRSGRLALAPDP